MRIDTNEDLKIIRFQGAILRKNAEKMEYEFANPPMNEHRFIILDFTRVHHICSSALGVLVSFKRRLRNRDGELKLVINDEDLKQVFEITMLDKVFDIYDTVEDATLGFENG